eukprot:SAG25_NODE_12789_length_275_cov_0.590909_1_plen_84_part_01
MAQRLVTVDDIRSAVRHSLATRFAMGEYDLDVRQDPSLNPWTRLRANETVNCPAHRELARRAAESTMVLVANGDADGRRALPLA